MSYDNARAVTVLFGGVEGDSTSYFGDTWEWNGSQWTQRSVNGPTPRAYGQMVFDPVRGVSVLVGGGSGDPENSFTPHNETWEWDGATWALKSNTIGGSGGTLIFDAARSVVSETQHGLTREWDGATWSSYSVGLPAPQCNGISAYDAARQKTVFFRGNDGDTRDDTCELDGTTWTRHPAEIADPTSRWQHAMAYDANRNVTVLFGGRDYAPSSLNDQALGDTWEWNGQTWAKKDVPGPSPRWQHRMAYDRSRGVTVLFGGDSGAPDYTTLGDTWEWDGASWTLVTSIGPEPRKSHTMCFDENLEQVLLFGGGESSVKGVYFGDTWTWDGSQWTLLTTAGPSPRARGTMAYDRERDVAVLYGGTIWVANQPGGTGGSMHNYSETWEWDGSSWALRADDGLFLDLGENMTFDSTRGKPLLFDAAGQQGSVREWNGTAWSLVGSNPFQNVIGPVATFDEAMGRATVFGGRPDDGDPNPTWIFGLGCGEQPTGENKNRYLAAWFPNDGTFARPSGPTALQVTMVGLQHPVPPNNPSSPPRDFSAYESGATCSDPGSCARWVGRPRDYADAPNAGTVRIARLQCKPYYHDWASEPAVQIIGPEIIPSSSYDLREFGATCAGAEGGCQDVSEPVRLSTGRYGDVASPYSTQTTGVQPDALDVTGMINKFRALPGSPSIALAQVQPNAPDPAEGVGALDIVAVIDAYRGSAYPFFGPCPCPSTVACGAVSCVGGADCGSGKCVRVCEGGAFAGDPCKGDSDCAGATCGSSFCRDACGRCSP